MITAEKLREVLDYDPVTGEFTWRAKVSDKTVVGRKAGTVTGGGRYYIGMFRKHYLAHRLAWLHVHGEWPVLDVDHVNGDTLDNRIVNLRLATKTQNQGNRKISHNCKSGLKGVEWHPQSGKWRARMTRDGKSRHIGLYARKEDAHAAYVREAERFFGDFACDGRR